MMFDFLEGNKLAITGKSHVITSKSHAAQNVYHQQFANNNWKCNWKKL